MLLYTSQSTLDLLKEELEGLKGMKRNINNDLEGQYHDILEITGQLEEEGLLYFGDIIAELNFIDSDLLEIYIKEVWDTEQIIYNLQGTENAELYIMNNYGHLNNITKDDIETLLYIVIEELESTINEAIIDEDEEEGEE
jgi:hypothetical protein